MSKAETVTFPTEQDQTQLAIDALFGDEGFLADDETDNWSAPTPSPDAICYACQPMLSTVHEDIRGSSPSCWRFSPRSLVVGLLLLLAGYFGSLAIRSPMGSETAQPANTAPGVVVDGVRYRPIETFRPCDRVVGQNPELTDIDRADFGPEPDPATWKLLTLRAPKRDGTTADVTMVEGPEWLAEHEPAIGSTVPISVPECGIDGMAEVLSIGPCPSVKRGEGPVVLATFKHYVGSTVDIHVSSLSDPIGCTGNHLFWSVDRQQFVRADELRPGENLNGFGPGAHVERVVTVGEPQHVYNIQVQGEHVYRVSEAGLLVHNVSELCKIQRTISHDVGVQLGSKYVRGKVGLQQVDDWVNPFDDWGRYGQGFDDIMEDAAGNIWIIEYKGGGATLAEGQMGRKWVAKNIARLMDEAAWNPMGPRLEKALEAGKLRGIAVRSTEGPLGIVEELGRWVY